jgi:hypothetical protein
MAEDEFFKRIAETAEPHDVVSDRPAGTAQRRGRQRAETLNNGVVENDGQETSADDAPGEHPTLLTRGLRGRRGVRSEVKRSDRRWFRAHLSMICAGLIGVCGIGMGMVVAPRGDSGASRSVQPQGAQLNPPSVGAAEPVGHPPAARTKRVDRRRPAVGANASGHSRSSQQKTDVASAAGVLQASIGAASASDATREGFGFERGR